MAPPPLDFQPPQLFRPPPTAQLDPIPEPVPVASAHVVPFIATLRVTADSSEKGVNTARLAEMRRQRRMKAFHRGCNDFLDSGLFNWTRRIITVGLVGFLGFTLVYMKKHKWRPWWIPQDPFELAIQRLRETPVDPTPTALPDQTALLPTMPASTTPSHANLDKFSVVKPTPEKDLLDQAATLPGL
jgi:hypothetical protein